MAIEHNHNLLDDDPHFTIEPDSRSIVYLSSDKLILVHNDHNSEKYTFEIPRMVDGHDMYACTSIQIHYTNIDAINTDQRYSDYHEVEDKVNTIDASGNDIVSFSWTIADYATQYVGTLSFAIKFVCKNSRGKIEYSWGTTPFTGVTVSSTIDAIDDEFIERNAEIIDRWYAEITSSIITETNVAVEMIRDVTDEIIEEIAGSVGGAVVSATEPTSENVDIWIKDSKNSDNGVTALLDGSDLGTEIDWLERYRLGPTEINSYAVDEIDGKIEAVTSATAYNHHKYSNLPIGEYDVYTYVNNSGRYMYFAYLTDSEGNIISRMCPQSTGDQKYEHCEFNIDTPGRDLYVMTISGGYIPQVISYRAKSVKIFDMAKLSLEETLTAELPDECIVTMHSPSSEDFTTGYGIKGTVGYGLDILSNGAFKYIQISDIGIGSYEIASRCKYSKGYNNFGYLVDANGIVVKTFLEVPSGTDELKIETFDITATDVINNSGKNFTLYLIEPIISIKQWYVLKHGVQNYEAKDIIKTLNANPAVMDLGRELVKAVKPDILDYNRNKKLLNFAWITDCHINGNNGNGDTIAVNNLRLLSEISKERFLDFTATGGDMFTAYFSTIAESVANISEFSQIVGDIPIPLFNVKGNHDTNAKCMYPENEEYLDWDNKVYYGYKTSTGAFVKIKNADAWNKATYPQLYYEDTTQRISASQWYTMFQNNVDAIFDTANPTGGYFYKDFENEKIRVLVINNFDADTCADAETYSNAQIAFVESAFTSLPSTDWNVVILSHVSIGTSTTMYTKLTAYKNRIICLIHGHTHVDGYSNSAGWNDIGTISGYGVVKDGHIGTADEFAFDIFTIDTTNKIIYETRIGRGESRKYSYGATVNQIAD